MVLTIIINVTYVDQIDQCVLFLLFLSSHQTEHIRFFLARLVFPSLAASPPKSRRKQDHSSFSGKSPDVIVPLKAVFRDKTQKQERMVDL